MSLETTAAPVAVDDDHARYAEMAKELGNPAPAAAPAAEPPAAAPAERKPDPLPYEELDKRYRNLQGALGEARGETRTIKQTMDQLTTDNQRMQQFLQRIAQQQTPAPDEDPYLGPVQRQVQALADQQRQILEYQKQQQETYEQQRRQQTMVSSVNASEAQFARENPDYYEAVEHLKHGRLQEYAVMYPDGHAATETMAVNNGFRTAAEMREAMLMQDVQHIGSMAMQQGMKPAEMAYNLSKQRGYTPRQAAPAALAAPAAPAARPQASRIDTIRQGQQAASSLSTGPTGSPTESAWPSHSELARMYLEDPEKAEGFIAKMQRSGALN